MSGKRWFYREAIHEKSLLNSAPKEWHESYIQQNIMIEINFKLYKDLLFSEIDKKERLKELGVDRDYENCPVVLMPKDIRLLKQIGFDFITL